MPGVDHAQVLIAGLLVAIVGLGALARALAIPYPIVLVVGGAALGFVPGLPRVELDPDIVLVVFLPPLLYGTAIFANLADFRANARGLTLSTVGLVLVTMGGVALVAHALIPDLPWAAAFVLGAIVSPTDPLAAATIMRRLGAPRRLLSGVEGEGLFNDATALVLYRVAVAAVVAGSFSLADATVEFVLGALGGVVIGVAVGFLVSELHRRTIDAQLSVTISLVTGYAAFVPAEALQASGVLAAVSAGLVMGVRGPHVMPPRTRLQGYFVWNILDYIINALLFVLVGLQLPLVLDGLSAYAPAELAGYGLAIAVVVTGVRVGWFFSVPYLIRALDRRPSQRERRVGAGGRFVLAWSGMRGSVSLAVALALPLTVAGGGPFPQRDLLIFLTFAVIFFTLVVQGLTLPAVMRVLGVGGTGDADGAEAREELRARLVAAKAALAELDVLAEEDWTREDTLERLRGAYGYRKRRFAARAGKVEDIGYEERTLAYQRTLQRLYGAQRTALLGERRTGAISNETMNVVLRELDLEESRLEI